MDKVMDKVMDNAERVYLEGMSAGHNASSMFLDNRVGERGYGVWYKLDQVLNYKEDG